MKNWTFSRTFHVSRGREINRLPSSFLPFQHWDHRNKPSLPAMNPFRIILLSSVRNGVFRRHLSTNSSPKNRNWPVILGISSVLVLGSGSLLYLSLNRKQERMFLTDHFNVAEKKYRERLGGYKNPGELRFYNFASMEDEETGQPLMTPRDFLDSVVQDKPRPRIKSKIIKEAELKQILKSTPSIAKYKSIHLSEDPKLLRSLDSRGVISFHEYLFLLSILTRPKIGFRVAFDIIDISEENFIKLEEYSKFVIFAAKSKKSNLIALDEKKLRNTTLATHFFGHDGLHRLTFDEFSSFIQGLQREVLKAEFMEYSRGLDTISEVDFARILLRYTDLSEKEQNGYFDLLESRLPPIEERPRLSFFQLENFFGLLNNLADFSFAFRLFARTGRPLSKTEFARAAKISMRGEELDAHVIDVIFALFDKADDQCLSYEEFFIVVKNRLHRQVRKSLHKTGWEGLKQCVREERINQTNRPI